MQEKNGMELRSSLEMDSSEFQLKGEVAFPLDRTPCISAIQPLCALAPEELEAELAKTEADIQALGSKADALLAQWAELASHAMLIRNAQKMQQAQARPAGLMNVWAVHEQAGEESWTIQNRVFAGRITLSRGKDYARNAQPGSVVWTVDWALCVNMNCGCQGNVLRSAKKVFSSKSEAMKYLQGRAGHLERKYFQTECPVIPKDYRSKFYVNGMPVPGFEYEEED